MKLRLYKTSTMQGFTLVELMVALTIGLIIMAAVSTLFVSSKRTYTSQDQLSRLQENARFAMQFIMSDLRLAGYYGCLDDVTSENVFSAVNSTALAYTVNQSAVEGLENAAGNWLPSGISDIPAGIRAGTDAVLIHMADPGTSAALTARMANTSAVLTVASTANFNTGDTVMVADCARADLMQVSGKTGTTISHATGNPPAPGNLKATLSKEYDSPASIMKFITRRYYILDNGLIPSLYRDDNGGAAQELVQGIEQLQILYGVDTDDPLDGVPNKYVKATSVSATNAKYGWSAVVTVRLGIIARTLDDKDTELDNRAYDVDGDGSTDLPTQNDRYKRRVFQATVQLRNML